MLAVGAALALRLVAPESMPVHTDEAVNAAILGDMLEGRAYRYDPVDRHGPSLYYATYPWARVLGARGLKDLEAWQLRLMPALFGAALIAAVLLLLPGVPCSALLAAALWLGLGAPLVYYGRTWIHETLFVLLTFTLLGTCWRYWLTGRSTWAVLAGLTAGTLVATKETFVLTLSAGVAALLATARVRRPGAEGAPARRKRDVLLAIGAAALAAALLFTSFGSNGRGVTDAFQALSHAAARAGGQGHEKPWSTYLAWLFLPSLRSTPWCGWTLFLFGGVGAWTAWSRRVGEPLPFFLLVYTAALAALYSAIPYKTPWLELNALAPAAILAGIGFRRACLAGPYPMRWPIAAALSILVAFALGSETLGLCFRFPADTGNPLAYSPTSPDIRRLEDRIEILTRQSGPHAPVVAVVGSDIWPLPWYLRRCPRVGYWADLPLTPAPSIVVSSADCAEQTARALGPGWKQEYYGLRPEVLAVLFTRPAATPVREGGKP